jgi:hypothetical protein
MDDDTKELLERIVGELQDVQSSIGLYAPSTSKIEELLEEQNKLLADIANALKRRD